MATPLKGRRSFFPRVSNAHRRMRRPLNQRQQHAPFLYASFSFIFRYTLCYALCFPRVAVPFYHAPQAFARKFASTSVRGRARSRDRIYVAGIRIDSFVCLKLRVYFWCPGVLVRARRETFLCRRASRACFFLRAAKMNVACVNACTSRKDRVRHMHEDNAGTTTCLPSFLLFLNEEFACALRPVRRLFREETA